MYRQAERTAEIVLNALPSSGFIKRGSFVSLNNSTVTIPDGGLIGAWIGAAFHICLAHHVNSGHIVARVSASYWPLTKDSMGIACSYFDTVSIGMRSGSLAVYTDVVGGDSSLKAFIHDLADACLLLDEVLVAATAFEAYNEPDPAFDEFDIKSLLESYGFGMASGDMAKRFYDEYDQPHERALARYALPYNLQKMADSGVLDAIIEENVPGVFALGAMIWKRWTHCEKVINALQDHGFTNEQVAFVACCDYDFFESLETRTLAEEMCYRIAKSRFNPEDPDAWSTYAATENGPLGAFL